MSLNNLISRVAVGAAPLPPNAIADNHSFRNVTAPHYSCDKKCTAITLGVSLPLLFILSVAAILYMVWFRRKEHRKEEEQRKADEEREIALRKLGGSEVWEGRSASDGGSVRGGVEGGVEERSEGGAEGGVEGGVERHEHFEEVRV